MALRGSLLVVRYGDGGEVLEGITVSAEGPVKGLEVPEGAWHSIVALERELTTSCASSTSYLYLLE